MHENKLFHNLHQLIMDGRIRYTYVTVPETYIKLESRYALEIYINNHMYIGIYIYIYHKILNIILFENYNKPY